MREGARAEEGYLPLPCKAGALETSLGLVPQGAWSKVCSTLALAAPWSQGWKLQERQVLLGGRQFTEEVSSQRPQSLGDRGTGTVNGIWEGPPWHPPQSTSPSSTIHTPPRCLWDSGWVVSRETCEVGELAEQSMAVPRAGLNPHVSLPTSHPGFPPLPLSQGPV